MSVQRLWLPHSHTLCSLRQTCVPSGSLEPAPFPRGSARFQDRPGLGTGRTRLRLAVGKDPPAPGRLLCPCRLSGVPSGASLPPLSRSICSATPPSPCVPCCAVWSPPGQGVTNCQVRAVALSQRHWAGHTARVHPVTTPAQARRGRFSSEMSALPHPAAWPA